MGYHVIAKGEDGVRVGNYGSQVIVAALLFAGYAVNGQFDSNRVAGWVAPIMPRTGPGEAPGAVTNLSLENYGDHYSYANLRNYPKKVSELIALNAEDSCWLTLSDNGKTIERGLKLKPAGDPTLEALVSWWEWSCDAALPQELPSGDPVVTQWVAAMDTVLPALVESCWYDTLTDIRNVLYTSVIKNVAVDAG